LTELRHCGTAADYNEPVQRTPYAAGIVDRFGRRARAFTRLRFDQAIVGTPTFLRFMVA
jgi:hypothetical protein